MGHFDDGIKRVKVYGKSFTWNFNNKLNGNSGIELRIVELKTFYKTENKFDIFHSL